MLRKLGCSVDLGFISQLVVGLLFLANFFKILKRIQHLKCSVRIGTKGNTASHKKPEVINEQIVPTTNGNNSSVNQVAATKVYQNTTVINEKNTVAVVLTTNPQNEKNKT
jgi:hypothetical protein